MNGYDDPWTRDRYDPGRRMEDMIRHMLGEISSLHHDVQDLKRFVQFADMYAPSLREDFFKHVTVSERFGVKP